MMDPPWKPPEIKAPQVFERLAVAFFQWPCNSRVPPKSITVKSSQGGAPGR